MTNQPQQFVGPAELTKIYLNEEPFQAKLIYFSQTLKQVRESLELNKEVTFLYEHKFPVNLKDEVNLSVAKVLVNFALYLKGNYIPRDSCDIEVTALE